jgi:membrane protein YqaA with SNARE-associated domain
LLALAAVSKGLWTWVLRLGGPGLVVVGLIDNSVIPIPGGMDFFVIVLTARDRDLWLYYAFMAVAGAVVGGYITYYLAEKGGKEGLEKKIGKNRAEKVYNKFENKGFVTVAVGAILPPPFPLVPVLMAAGVLQYPRKKFVTALTAGRTVRFLAVAYLGRIYGTAILHWLGRYYKPFLYALIAAGVAGGIAAFVYFKWYRPKRQHQQVGAPH